MIILDIINGVLITLGMAVFSAVIFLTIVIVIPLLLKPTDKED